MKQEEALAYMKTGKNIFLTGSAGTGKTHILNQYIKYLRERKVPVSITASTGIAATHIKGQTIHSWCGMGIKDEMTDQQIEHLKSRKYLLDKIANTRVLIIDEISMLHKKQLDLVNRIMKQVRLDPRPFGGIQVIFSGDFFQLPPVGLPEETIREKFSFMSSAWLEAALVICYLEKQYRQTEDKLKTILEEIRSGNVSEYSRDLLKETSPNSDSIKESTQLYTHNFDVDQVNKQYLMNLEGEGKVYSAITKGKGNLIENLKKSVLADRFLELKEGAKVMFVKNNFEKGYMNGSIGIVTGFNNENVPVVTLLNGRTIFAEEEIWSIEDESGKTLASFKQIPLRLAWAITVHKSQGMTLDEACVDLSKTFEKGQGYVALSRLTSIEGLKLIGFNDIALEAEELSLKADKRFRELSSDAMQEYHCLDLQKEWERFILLSGGLTDEDQIQMERKKIKKGKVKKKASHLITADLIERGHDLKSIMKERGLTENTILNHVMKLRKMFPEMDLGPFMPDREMMDKVNNGIRKIEVKKGSKGAFGLKELYEILDGEASYTDLRLALSFREEKQVTG
jgi:hypothetical protein